MQQGEAVGRHHVHSDTGEQHHARPHRLVVTSAQGFENLDFAREVEVVHAAAEARVDHRFRRAAERAGAVRDGPHAVDTAIDGRCVIEREHTALKPGARRERRELSLRAAGEDGLEAHGGRPLGHQLSGVPIRAVDEDAGHSVQNLLCGKQCRTPSLRTIESTSTQLQRWMRPQEL